MQKAPECKTCGIQTSLADAGVLTSIPFWYCVLCKEEIDDRGFVVKPKEEIQQIEELNDYLEEQIAEMEAESGTAGLNYAYYKDLLEEETSEEEYLHLF